MPQGTPESPKAIEQLELVALKRRAFEMRMKYKSYREIALELGRSIGTIRLWVKEATVTMLPPEEAEELRARELAAIDSDTERAYMAMQMLGEQAEFKRLNNADINEELEALRRWQEHLVSLRKQRALLTGINIVKVEHTHKVKTEFDSEIEALVAELSGGGKVMTLPDEVMTDD